MTWGYMTVCTYESASLIHWAVPYLIGRLYFGSPEGIRELAIGIVIGGLLCILPCLYEMKMSPYAVAPGLRNGPM